MSNTETRIDTVLSSGPSYLTRVDTSRGGRYYMSPDNPDVKYYSVTSMTGMKNNPGIRMAERALYRRAMNDWIGEPVSEEVIDTIFGQSEHEWGYYRDIGSAIHEYLEKLYMGFEDTSDVTDFYEPAVKAWYNWHSSIEAKFLETESAIIYDLNGIQYAGTIDALYEKNNGDLLVVDFKTGGDGEGGIYTDHAMQVAAYCRAVEKMTGKKTTGLVVRFIMQHPQIPLLTKTGKQSKTRDGKLKTQSDKSKDKYFTGKYETAEVNPSEWLPAFDATCVLHGIRNIKIDTVTV